MSAPPQVRLEQSLFMRIVQREWPELLQIPISKGTPWENMRRLMYRASSPGRVWNKIRKSLAQDETGKGNGMKVSWALFWFWVWPSWRIARAMVFTQGAPGPRIILHRLRQGFLTARPARRRTRPGVTHQEIAQASGVAGEGHVDAGRYSSCFAPAVDYRGSISIKASGAPRKPITYSGQGWGTGRAIVSGRDAVSVPPRPCSSLPLCAQAAECRSACCCRSAGAGFEL